VFLKPAGIRALFGVASGELSSRVVHLCDLWGSCSRDLLETLLAATTWQQRFSILDRAFLSRLNPIDLRPEIAWAWQRLDETHGAIPIQSLAREIGWSRRHFSERFRDLIGATPKSAARVFRFERACRVIVDQRPSLANVAASCGYFDQAHMTREWRALAGCSPKTWIAQELPFVQDYEVAGCDNERDEPDSIYQSFV
jgi:AraC-like DNA-binding protein